jgi:dolichol-phosphate mannosyltransferase
MPRPILRSFNGGRVRENLRYCVILPAYNESRHLASVVSRIPDWVDGILVIDDASTDDTLQVAESLTDTRVSVRHLEKNQGVGGAMVAGFRAVLEGNYDVAIKMDADGQMDVDELSILVRPIELGMAEYVKGNRFRRTGRPAAMPARRWFGNVVLSFLTKVASGYWHVFDPQCGFIAITIPTLRRLKLDGMARDYFFENDMLIRLNVVDARVVDVDTSSLYGDETSYVNLGRVSWSFPPRLVRGFLWRFTRRHLMNDFSLVGFLTIIGVMFTLFGSVFGLYHWIRSVTTGIPATSGTVLIAAVPLILGIQMLIQALSLEVQSSAGADETRKYARMGNSSGKPPSGGR